MSFQQSINSALFSAAHVRFFGKAAKAIEKNTKAITEKDKEIDKKIAESEEIYADPLGNARLDADSAARKLKKENPNFGFYTNREKGITFEGPDVDPYNKGKANIPEPGADKETVNKYVEAYSKGAKAKGILKLTPQEKATESLNKNLAEKAEQKAAFEERKELVKDPKAVVAQANEAPTAVRRTEISASEAKKLIQESEQKKNQKKELEEKAKKALEEGGNK